MAMAFAPLALKVPIIIADANVVSKSYPDFFWDDMKTLSIKFLKLFLNYQCL
jgi:3-phosphoshikimate 1-carboxyvinyltransferase